MHLEESDEAMIKLGEVKKGKAKMPMKEKMALLSSWLLSHSSNCTRGSFTGANRVSEKGLTKRKVVDLVASFKDEPCSVFRQLLSMCTLCGRR